MPLSPKIVGPEDALAVGEALRLGQGELEAFVAAVARSEPTVLMSFGDTPLAAFGFIPTDLLGQTAYAWMEWTPAIYNHPMATARAWREVFAAARRRYSRIFGHCSYGERPVRLLTHLGAKFWTDAEGRPTYVIEGTDEHA